MHQADPGDPAIYPIPDRPINVPRVERFLDTITAESRIESCQLGWMGSGKDMGAAYARRMTEMDGTKERLEMKVELDAENVCRESLLAVKGILRVNHYVFIPTTGVLFTVS